MTKTSRLAPWLLSLGLLAAAAQAVAGEKEEIAADMQAGRWTQAEHRLDGVIKKHPENPLAYYWLAEVKYEQHDYAGAQQALQRARELDPSERFASTKTMVQKIDRGAPAQAAAPAQSLSPSPAPALRTQVPDPAPAPKKSSFSWLWILLLLGLGVFFWRKLRGSVSSGDQERWRGALMEAHKDLGDAVAASDANAQLSPEVKLANYDRVRKAQAEINAHLETLAGRQDFGETQSLVMRSRDIAAEIRGEEKPSDKARRMDEQRLQAEAQARAMQAPYGVQQPGFGQGGGSGVLGTVAAVGAGVAIGSLLSGSAEAGERHRHRDNQDGGGGGYIPFDDASNRDQLDLGGSDGGASWDSGGSDIDTGGGGSFD